VQYLTIIVQSIEKLVRTLKLPSKKDDEIMFKKVTMLEGEKYSTCITIIESNIYSYQDVSMEVEMGIQIHRHTLATILAIFSNCTVHLTNR
jgi:hypothetical protein